MSKFKSFYVCSSCGYKSVSQMGKCPECGEWNTMIEEVEMVEGKHDKGNRGNRGNQGKTNKPIKISEINQEKTGTRISTGFSEVDRVLGGGMVLGSVILIAGEPGVGKSTLLLQIARKLSEDKGNRGDRGNQGKIVLYVSGEESEGQIAIRYERLEQKEFVETRHGASHDGKLLVQKVVKSDRKNNSVGETHNSASLLVLNETNVDLIIKIIEESRPDLIIVDSVQTIYTDDLSGTAGSVGQVRECASRLSNTCKSQNLPLFLVGQITKEGAIAGPKVLEHMVDVVLQFEGEHFQNLRILRSMKNRFGPIDEAGIFEMGDVGLLEVENPSEIFLGGENGRGDKGNRGYRGYRSRNGAVLTCTLEGTRPIIAEIQALTVYSTLPMPRRVFSGLDFNRCQVVMAVLQKFLNIDFSHLDVYVSTSGGLKIKEPAADLAIALSLVSSVKQIVFDAVCYGEIGLLGDIRRVNNMSQREKECKRLGYKKVMSSEEVSNIRELSRSQESKKVRLK